MLRIGSPNSDTIGVLTSVQVENHFALPETQDTDEMSGALDRLIVAIGFLTCLSATAHASPVCFKDKQAFALADDIVSWTMSAAPGSECIQGLRWSYMQIYNVVVLKAPTKGKLVIVGSGFRYIADSESKGADNFTLVVFGKNRHDPGSSVLDVAVKYSPGTVVSELPRRPDPSPLAAIR
jgi:hypothetical protein